MTRTHNTVTKLLKASFYFLGATGAHLIFTQLGSPYSNVLEEVGAELSVGFPYPFYERFYNEGTLLDGWSLNYFFIDFFCAAIAVFIVDGVWIKRKKS